MPLAAAVVGAAAAAAAATPAAGSGPPAGAATAYNSSWPSLAAHPYPAWFRDAKFGIYNHFGVYSVPAYAARPSPFCTVARIACPAPQPNRSAPSSCGPCQGPSRCTCPAAQYSAGEWYPHFMYVKGTPTYQHHVATYGGRVGYKDFIANFTASKFSPKGWAQLYRRAGALYGGPVSEHSDGFAMFNTSLSHFNAAQMGPKRDIVEEVLAAVRAEGLRTVTTFHNHFLWGWYDTWSPMFGENDATDPQLQLTQDHGGLYGQRVDNSSCGLAGTSCPRGGPCSSPLFEDYTMGKPAEAVRMFKPDLVYFDGQLTRRVSTAKIAEFLALYYNAAAGWGKGREGIVTFKDDPLIKSAGPHAASAIKDLERGGAKTILAAPWQTDDSMDPNTWSWAEPPILKNSTQLICELVDIVSKNGNLLLNVPPKADGSFDSRVVNTLHEIGDWLSLNGAAIYKTRPWTTCCEDNANATRVAGGWPIYNPGQFRFTTSAQAIFVTAFGWPAGGSMLVHSLNSSAPLAVGAKISNCTIVGSNAAVTWTRLARGLSLTLPAQKPAELPHRAWVLRVHVDGAEVGAIDAPTARVRRRIVDEN